MSLDINSNKRHTQQRLDLDKFVYASMSTEPGPQSDTEAAEDQISPVVRRRLQECFNHGTQVATGDKPDADYANTMLIQCVVNDPGNLVYYEAFLDNLQTKYKNNKKGARVKGFGGRGPFKKALSKKDWRDVLRQGPEILKTNPWDVPTLRGMAQACEEFGYNEVELRLLKNALDANPKDADVNRHCGRSLARMGQFDQAIACWHRVEELDPKDKDATKMVSLLTEDKQRVAAGLAPKSVEVKNRMRKGAVASEEQPADEVEADEQQQPKERQKRREVSLTPRQKLERAISDNPEDIKAYLQLADLLQNESRHADVERVLTKALAASGNDLKVRERLEDASLERQRQQLAIAEKRARVEQTEQADDLAKQMRAEVNRREVEVFGARVERYPNDIQLKFELAVRLKRDGNYAEAANYFLQTRDDPELKTTATLELGECFQHQKKFKKALQCYVRAVDLAVDDVEQRKAALYRAGVLSVGLKKIDTGERFLQDLAEIDPSYKDLPSRLDKLNRIRHKG